MNETEPTPRFFGYGSLVNRRTHDYPNAAPMTVRGWRRAWRHTSIRDVAFLTAVPDSEARIDGLAADVPGGDWGALDLREAAYAKVVLPSGEAIYQIPDGLHAKPTRAHPILLSYLDVVVQGFRDEFGEAGVARFFETTSGWDAPVRDDRGAPEYPRAQVLSAAERALVDRWLGRVA
ncbi:gamma-glutamylcyclotransferase family protein [Jannaschia sp. W003]|uniref:gamma-glutamylcyclotransferase family protein n=1 Tax=Jannaschia sp. W003 TaxID=2867012 RepID=UPI0021A553D0|nr:gamma-glutamylcyclotransferase family protein [Jannaschia sp. W003]UWQ20058.1 gamma-glutamylcyclotransferase [Jannaschia sp. W003]